MSCARAPPKPQSARWGWSRGARNIWWLLKPARVPILPAWDTQIIIQSGEAVESGLIVFRFNGLIFGVLGKIKGSDMALGQNWFSYVLLYLGFLAEVYLWGASLKNKNETKQ